ncbi:MAG: amino acid--tRNA ligase-related protein, partial [Patescibacteria group bacterium]|nr:amino acid--tRNA ligase-related protein [Patescibacteria group bacterium]
MIPDYLKNQIRDDDLKFKGGDPKLFVLPEYNPKTHYLELTKSGYFQTLITLRHYIKAVSDYYFGVEQKAKNIDLFMLTPSISSPMGSGSDSEAIPIKFGKYNSNLVDSSQFGFEPLLLNGIDKVYCYLPSMRGENPDKRHLNQFFHCEAEIKGDIGQLTPIIEGYIKILSETLLLMPNILEKISLDYKETLSSLNKILELKEFPEITFNEAVDALIENGNRDLVNFTELGRDISSGGEIKLAEIFNFKTPFWIRNYDRNRVSFYQKPDPEDSGKVINADLIFPPIIKDSFGGEIVGCGQRQDNTQEMIDSLSRQSIESEPYEWYIDLRNLPNYEITSGFGLGIERFIIWSLCRDDIKDVIPYPRLKNIKTYP